MGAETYDVDLGHSGRKIAEKRGEGKGGSQVGPTFPCITIKAGDMQRRDARRG